MELVNKSTNVIEKTIILTLSEDLSSLEDFRDRIDELDNKLIALLANRMGIARSIGEYKKKNGESVNPMLYTRLPVLKKEIEKQIARIEKGDNNELLEIVKLYYDE